MLMFDRSLIKAESAVNFTGVRKIELSNDVWSL